MDIREASRRMATIALDHPGTVGTLAVFEHLRQLSGSPHDRIITQEVVGLTAEIARLRLGGIPQVRLPHEAAVLLEQVQVALLGGRPPRSASPGVVDGTWVHEGIVEDEVLTLSLGPVEDFARREDEGRHVRIARCRVERLGSDVASTTPYIWFTDLDRPHEGQGMLSLEAFRRCMAPSEPAPGTGAGRGR